MLAIVGQITRAAKEGIGALAPMLFGIAPNGARVLLAQRYLALATEQAASLSRVCGDAAGIAMGAQGDISDANIASINAGVAELQGLAAMARNALDPAFAIGADDIARAYRRAR